MINLLALLYYITSSIEIIPSICRICKRKSSNDYSVLSTWIMYIGTVAWTVYIFLTKQDAVVYIGTVIDMVMCTIYLFVILKYHK